jgi:hypothetical protein
MRINGDRLKEGKIENTFAMKKKKAFILSQK